MLSPREVGETIEFKDSDITRTRRENENDLCTKWKDQEKVILKCDKEALVERFCYLKGEIKSCNDKLKILIDDERQNFVMRHRNEFKDNHSTSEIESISEHLFNCAVTVIKGSAPEVIAVYNDIAMDDRQNPMLMNNRESALKKARKVVNNLFQATEVGGATLFELDAHRERSRANPLVVRRLAGPVPVIVNKNDDGSVVTI